MFQDGVGHVLEGSRPVEEKAAVGVMSWVVPAGRGERKGRKRREEEERGEGGRGERGEGGRGERRNRKTKESYM